MKPLRSFLFTIVFVVFFKSSFQRKLPSIFTPCKYSTDKAVLGECMKAEYLRNKDKFLVGIPELHLPSYDPFFLEKLKFETGSNNNAMSFTVLFTNLNMYGTKDLVLEKLLFDVENIEVVGETYFPDLRIVADYEIKGNILVLPLDSTGKADLNFIDVRTKDKYKGKKYTKNGKEYIKFDESHSDVTIKKLHVYFDNLINGNQVLTNSTNAVFNENSDALIDELKFVMAETFASIRLYLLNSLFNRYPLNELFPST